MELEQYGKWAFKNIINFITLFLYGIGATNITTTISNKKINYIIPIWNWSELNGFLIEAGIIITLFLYGIGANLYSWIFFIYFFYYIIPIWNWSSHSYQFFSNLLIYYIIPIWNWSYFCAISFILSTSYYIIPIWNWSCVFRY